MKAGIRRYREKGRLSKDTVKNRRVRGDLFKESEAGGDRHHFK